MNSVQGKKLVIVDGSSYLFRAYHALPPLTNSKGMPTGAIYGVVNMLRKLLQDEDPDYFAVIFDTKSKNFRHEIFPEYKANRAQMPDDLGVQIAPIHEIIRAMGLPLIAMEGIEADDVIGSLAQKAVSEGLKVLISTSDKDIAQLVDENITLVNTMSGSRLDEKNVLLKFGVKPNQIIDYLTLIGDPVDNVPGVPKVGPKTAAKWINEYSTLENIIENAHAIKGKVGENLREAIPLLAMSKNLVTIKQDLPLPHLPTDLEILPYDKEKLSVLFEELEFKTWLKELEKVITYLPASEPLVANDSTLLLKAKGEWEIICSEQALLSLLDEILTAKFCVLNVITSPSENPVLSNLIGIALSVTPFRASYIPLAHSYENCSLQLSQEWVITKLKTLFASKEIIFCALNSKQVMHALERHDMKIDTILHDPMLQSYVLNSIATRHDKESLAKYYLQHQSLSLEEIAGKGAKKMSFDKIDIQKAGEYAAEEADITMRLHQTFINKLYEIPSLQAVYEEIEMPLVKVLWKIEQTGVGIDGEKLSQQSKEIEANLAILEEQAYVLAGEVFNLASPKQLSQLFYDKLKLPILEKTPKGAPSTAESVLQALSEDYELPKILLQHRGLSKLKSTYTDKLPLQINPHTHRVHTTYQQAITATGRLSSTDPNLQNIPIRTEEGRKIRQAFVASPGKVILAADYSQIELRIMAHLSNDKGLLAAFKEGQDIHLFTASEVLGIPIEKVTPVERRNAKAINFGLIYGMSAFGLAKQLQISRQAAQEYMEQYFRRYPGVKNYMDEIRLKAQELGYVETLLGRRLYVPDIRAKHVGRKRAAERTAINAPMQGTAADIIKKAMISLSHEIDKLTEQNDIRMIMQVHDELVFEVNKNQVEKAKLFIKECMQNSLSLSVPLIVDIGVGQNWDEAH